MLTNDQLDTLELIVIRARDKSRGPDRKIQWHVFNLLADEIMRIRLDRHGEAGEKNPGSP